MCRDGLIADTCQPNSPSNDGDLCDGQDDDCDGRFDEDHVEWAVTCGVGACEANGRLVCESGLTDGVYAPRPWSC